MLLFDTSKMAVTIDRTHSLETLLEGCKNGNPKSQELLYRQFYGYAMSVCLRYTRSRDEALEILNDGFIKVFNHAGTIDPTKPFKNWLRRVMVNTALDFYRQNHKHYYHEDIENAHYLKDNSADAQSEINYQELIDLIQQLSPGYRTVFNLFVIDGYSHEEIGKMLGISEGTSKSNLARARVNLREMLSKRG
jgi:RNA polymerase sigma factor (sigma-70 family)